MHPAQTTPKLNLHNLIQVKYLTNCMILRLNEI